MDEQESAHKKPFGGTRKASPHAVSYSQVEHAARNLMKLGERPTVRSVIKAMGKGSPNVVADCLRRFWKDTAAMGSGDPLALMRLPPELADAAVAQWTQALRFAQQSVRHEDSAAEARLEQLEREASARVQSVELREKEWDMAARIRDTALADARAQVSHLLKEQARDRASLREKDAKIGLLEAELLELREKRMIRLKGPATRSRKAPRKLSPLSAKPSRHRAKPRRTRSR